jgi:glutamate-1-semialdehyde 2,1-aminomutase
LLIFDEVMTGFRVAPGGAQQLYRVRPDLTCLGKIIGGGLPVGAYGGRRDLMQQVSPIGPVYQAGTLSGNPLAVAAGIATLEALAVPGTYERLEATAASLAQGLLDAAGSLPVQCNRVGSMWTLFFSDHPVTNYATALQCSTRRYAAFFHAMLHRGIYLPPSQFESAFVSTAHGDEQIEQTIAAAREAFADAAQVGA